MLQAQTIIVTESNTSSSILSKTQVYIDNEVLSLPEVISLDRFHNCDKSYVNFGMTEDRIWVRFTLQNASLTDQQKLLVINNPFLLEATLYGQDRDHQWREIKQKRQTLSPSYILTLKPEVPQVYYLEIKSASSLKFGLFLESVKEYKEEDLHRQIINILFLGVILTLTIYNFLLYLVIKDKAYFYYGLYLFFVFVLEISYVGLAPLYFNDMYTYIDRQTLIEKVGLIVIFYGLFFIEFLKLRQIIYLYRVNQIFIILAIAMMLFTFLPYVLRMHVILATTFTFTIFNFYASIISYRQGLKHARLFILGFGVVLFVYLIMSLDALGIISIVHYFQNMPIIATAIEAMILSLAFVDKFYILQKQKADSDQKLLLESRNREAIVQEEVERKTTQLQKSIQVQDVLFNELHHRVKNNLQLILSITRLQKGQFFDKNLQEPFESLEKRIDAIAQTHSLIYLSKDIETIEMQGYLVQLTTHLKESDISSNITLKYEIDQELHLDIAVTIGLIVNELVYNAIKYAFDEKGGIVTIVLKDFYLEVYDNGKGYDSVNVKKESLGLQLVKSLVHSQLRGTIEMDTSKGTKYMINFKQK